ncbi:magnesium chelatase subunit D, partial [Elioraea sp.]|uniref:magnesium chelatase subunit D n=1 Tax=Elioraea sp. TaxID=2185103 RepID=UPI003F6F44D2
MLGEAPSSQAEDAWRAAAVFAVDPAGTGVLLRAGPGPARDRWLARLRALWPEDAPLRRVPASVPDDRLLGGLDLTATLAAGRAVAERGILAAADGGAVILAMAERLPAGTAARIAAASDAGEVAVQRDGIDQRLPARFGVVALDEGLAEDERTPRSVAERLAMHLSLDAGALPQDAPGATITRARARLGSVAADAEVLRALCAAALALGVGSLRAPLQALRVARAAAALAGRDTVAEPDVALAARLVLAPRATRLPEPETTDAEEPPEVEPPSETQDRHATEESRPIEDVILAAAKAAIPAGLLASLRLAGMPRGGGTQGKAGAMRRTLRRGRPAGTRSGRLGSGDRLALVETLRAAAPWQALRRLEAAERARRVIVRRDDIRLVRLKAPSQTTAIFVVDASGSAALARLAEVKGAVELLLADCYVRRDTVALIAFRGTTAELVLPPTGSLARARR